jgi:LytS/YehU family sensor histidine kinase
MKLSEILRYVLYDSNTGTINVENEIRFIHSYMNFVQLRNDRVKIDLTTQLDETNNVIAPLLFLPFIENAIKHGIGKHINNPWIRIFIRAQNNQVVFECTNSNHNKMKIAGPKVESGGIGLKNVKKRLALLYENRYQLKITDSASEYKVNLTLSLA